MFKIFIFFNILLSYKCTVIRDGNDSSNVIIKTRLGSIQGSELRTWKNSVFYGFRGIRYGQAPLNDLRFKDPVPVDAWSDVFDGTKDGPMCPQPGKNETEYSEDCLRLNIYVKRFPNCRDDMRNECANVKKPVLLYIPGGGYYVGSGVSSDYGGPYYLMEHDIVLVTINYRLGFLGFLNLGTKEYPGNAGFKDQILAMRFVRDHIDAFGGDPKRVTIIGNSAGSFSVAMHLLSPMSRDLFHQGILGSGGLDVKMDLPTEQISAAKKQARLFKCPHSELNTMIECLKSKSTKEYVDTVYKTFTLGRSPWGPVVEQDFGQERYFTEQPRNTLLQGNYMKVPLIAGVTKDESVASGVGVLKNSLTTFALDHTWNIILPKVLEFEGFTLKSYNISRTLRKFYNIPSPMTLENSVDSLSQLLSDAAIGFGTHRIAKFMEKFKPVYQYKFSYIGRYSHLYYPSDKPYGAEHSDDFIYLLCRNRTAPIFTTDDPEAPIIEYMTRFYTNFVIYGNPNNETDPLINKINWVPLNDQNRKYLNIDQNLLIQSDLFKDRYGLWDELFPIEYPK